MLKGMFSSDDISRFRLVGFFEGISYILLLFIAMPLKYMYDMPIAVKIVGMTHGILFILFIITFFLASLKNDWNLKDNATFFIASLIPFGTFLTDKKLVELQKKSS